MGFTESTISSAKKGFFKQAANQNFEDGTHQILFYTNVKYISNYLA
jgi:hypothetical protein